MNVRLTLAARIGLLLVASASLVWLGTLAIFYASPARAAPGARPLIEQASAIVQVLERTSATERPMLLRALTSDSMTVRIAAGTDLGPASVSSRVTRLTARALDTALAEIGGRAHSVTLLETPGVPSALQGRWFVTPANLEIRVALATHETLVVDVTRAPVTNVFGLPAGFIAGLLGAFVGFVALFDSFTHLRSRVAALLRERMALIGGLSHDVRTFATRLRLQVERIPSPAERERAGADIDAMIRLLDDSLLSSRAGAGELGEELIDLREVVLAEISVRQAAGKSVDWRDETGDVRVFVLGDRMALRRVISNVLDNALDYGRVAHVRLDASAQDLTLIVDDEGPGIPPEHRQSVFEPFVRLERSRSRRTGGAGLGLAIVHTLVEAHSGRVEISSAPGGGARVAISLPRFVT